MKAAIRRLPRYHRRPDAEGEQVIVVRAEDQPEDLAQPRGKQEWLKEPHVIWYHRTSGIWQPVWLEPVGDVHISKFHLTPDIARSTVTVEATLNRKLKAPGAGSPSRSARTASRSPCSRCGSPTPSCVRSSTFRCRARRDPQRPLLGRRIAAPDRRICHTDLRERRPGRHHRQLFRPQEHQRRPRPLPAQRSADLCPLGAGAGILADSHLTAPSPAALKREVERIKSLGFNAVRIHQKVKTRASSTGATSWG